MQPKKHFPCALITERPQSGDIIIDFAGARADFTVSCDDTNSAAIPAMSTFNIYSNGTLITKAVSDKAVIVTEPEEDTEFRCEGSNYLGSTNATKTFYPGSKYLLFCFFNWMLCEGDGGSIHRCSLGLSCHWLFVFAMMIIYLLCEFDW